MMTVLETRGVEVRYGVVEAVRGVDLKVAAGQITAVLGANGAGKTSLLSAISGLVTPSAGTVQLKGEDITSQSVSTNVTRGMVHVPEGRRIIAPLSVEENLLLGGHTRSARQRKETLDQVFEIFPRLVERKHSAGGLLSGGEQQMLAFGRALMANPEVMLLDEPSMGLAPIMVDVVMDTVQKMAAQGIGILMVEQNAAAVMSIASYAYVMEQGSVVLEGTAEEISNDAGVVRAYLGLDEVDDGDGS
jgi:branched-chain amino acid transport system ATP-binding protein